MCETCVCVYVCVCECMCVCVRPRAMGKSCRIRNPSVLGRTSSLYLVSVVDSSASWVNSSLRNRLSSYRSDQTHISS